MESPLSFFRTHWDHEPTPNPSQEGIGVLFGFRIWWEFFPRRASELTELYVS